MLPCTAIRSPLKSKPNVPLFCGVKRRSDTDAAMHADTAGRDSLVYDVMEFYRPVVDASLLAFLDRTTFRKGDFFHVTDGCCRLHPQLGRAIVAACRVSSSSVDASIRQLRERLLPGVGR